MRTRCPLLLALSAPACLSADPGTIVGNPGQMRVAVAPAHGLTLDGARLTVEELRFVACDGAEVAMPIEGSLDLIDPVLLQAPGGTWCGLHLDPAGPLLLDGAAPAGGRLMAELNLPAVDIAANQLQVDGGFIVVELGGPGWLNAQALGINGRDDVSIVPGDPLHDGLVEAISTLSAAYPDDGDGWVSDAERALGGGDTQQEDDDEDSDGDGQGAGSAVSGWNDGSPDGGRRNLWDDDGSRGFH